MELFWFILQYEKDGSLHTEYFPTVLERSRRENELRKNDVEFTKETQLLNF